MRNAGLDEAEARIKIAKKNINKLRYADDTTLMAEIEEQLKSFLMKVKKESEKTDFLKKVLKKNDNQLKAQHSKTEDHGIQSHHFMANRWRNNGKSERLYFLGSKITADGDCSRKI